MNAMKDDKEYIMTFFREGMLFTEFTSYLTERPSKYILIALEDTQVYAIRKDDINTLCNQHHCKETLFSQLFSFTTLNMMKRITEMLKENANPRYKKINSVPDELWKKVERFFNEKEIAALVLFISAMNLFTCINVSTRQSTATWA